jgi:hypothetical protein
MTRKHYRELAADLHRQYAAMTDRGEVRGFWSAVITVADVLQLDNPRFDRHKFYAAIKDGL